MSARIWAGIFLFSAGCVVDTSGSSTRRRPAPLQIGPCFQTVGVGAPVQVDVVGGVPPYRFFVSANSTGARIDDSGHYVAGPQGGVDTLEVFDANGVTASVNLEVTRAFLVGPQLRVLRPGAALQLVASGGAAPVRFALASNVTGASIDASSGRYVAGSGEGADTVLATDATGASATVDLTVSATLPEGTQSCPASQVDSFVAATSSEAGGDWAWDTDYTGNYDYTDSTGSTDDGASSTDDGWQNAGSTDPGPSTGSEPDPSEPGQSEDAPPTDTPPDTSSDDSSDDSGSSSDDDSGWNKQGSGKKKSHKPAAPR